MSPPVRGETLDLRVRPHWNGDGSFWFLRRDESGERQVVDVDVGTGDMVPRRNRANRDALTGGLVGGPSPRSAASSSEHTEIRFINRTDQPVTAFWITTNGRRTEYATIRPGDESIQHTYVGHAWEVVGRNGDFYGSLVADGLSLRAEVREVYPRDLNDGAADESTGRETASPSPRQTASGYEFRLRGGCLQVRRLRSSDPAARTSESAGSDADDETSAADRSSWRAVESVNSMCDRAERLVSPELTPDGRFLALWKRRAAENRHVTLVESSPAGGGRAIATRRPYRLPGDPTDQYVLIVCETDTWQPLDLSLPVFDFGRPRIRMHGDHQLLIEKVDRGHQRFRLFRVDPATETVVTPIDESSETFIWTAHGPPVPTVTYLPGTGEVIHASERSGWRHLYRVDLSGSQPPRPITSGDFVVRELIHVDVAGGRIDLAIGGYYADQDPYFRHLARVNFDGSDFVVVTDGNGDHQGQYSPDRSHVVVTHSRVDALPTHELRRVHDGVKIATLARARHSASGDRSSRMPTVFNAKGRDGRTDIWGMITFPPDYDPASTKRYPVLESIYAGPHDSHVPKRYRQAVSHQDLNDAGFIVVSIDGMGTANRSKAFHDVCWQDLKDAGFPDRIAWMKAAASHYPAMDLSRVGIFGTSAGGQNAMGALLFHGDFYHAAVASCGCHDNRMDKASWNEQWMGYPVGPHYSASSNVENAHRLGGDLLLIVGELDTNVPPESTLRVVDALIKADKDFQFLMIPGLGHSNGGKYGWRRTKDFFRQALHPQAPSG